MTRRWRNAAGQIVRRVRNDPLTPIQPRPRSMYCPCPSACAHCRAGTLPATVQVTIRDLQDQSESAETCPDDGITRILSALNGTWLLSQSSPPSCFYSVSYTDSRGDAGVYSVGFSIAGRLFPNFASSLTATFPVTPPTDPGNSATQCDEESLNQVRGVYEFNMEDRFEGECDMFNCAGVPDGELVIGETVLYGFPGTSVGSFDAVVGP